MVQCCPTGFTFLHVRLKEIKVKRVRANFELTLLLLSRKDPMVQCCPFGFTTRPSVLEEDGVGVHVQLHRPVFATFRLILVLVDLRDRRQTSNVMVEQVAVVLVIVVSVSWCILVVMSHSTVGSK